MNFNELHRRLSPRLKAIARHRNRIGSSFDENDLYQEMSIYMWNTYKNGVPADINDSYIVKGCEFHILNYIRKEKDKRLIISIEEPINENGDTLKELLPDNSEAIDRHVERDMAFNKIMNNGFTKPEKRVLALLLKGHTVREAAKKLGISHVMVVKYKKNVVKKWHMKGYHN